MTKCLSLDMLLLWGVVRVAEVFSELTIQYKDVTSSFLLTFMSLGARPGLKRSLRA